MCRSGDRSAPFVAKKIDHRRRRLPLQSREIGNLVHVQEQLLLLLVNS